MADYVRIPFATSGNRTPIPQTTQGSGVVSMQEGFGPDYQLDPGSDPDAKVIPRGSFNQLMYLITTAIQYLQQVGYPEFITTAQNGGTPYAYAKYATVMFDNGSGPQLFQSLVDSNETTPANTSNWVALPLGGASIPAGCIMAYGGNTAPSGWALCYGQELVRADNSALFTAIGTTYGVGNGTTTFNLPDLRGRVPLGRDNMGGAAGGTGTAANRVTAGVSGLDATSMGTAGGDQRMAQHTHAITDPGHSHAVRAYAGANGDNSGVNASLAGTAGSQTGTSTTGISVQNSGAGTSQNVQPSLVTTYIIKL